MMSLGLTTHSETAVVRTSKDGDLLVVTIDHSPGNAISVDVRRGLMTAMDEAEADASVKGVLLLDAGRAFIAGADISEFGHLPMHPILPEVCTALKRAASRWWQPFMGRPWAVAW